MKLGVRGYVVVWTALVALGALSLGLSFAPLGALQMPLALVIAAAKAGLVVAFFMHVAEQKGTSWLYLALAVFLVVTLVGLAALDVGQRVTTSVRARAVPSARLRHP